MLPKNRRFRQISKIRTLSSNPTIKTSYKIRNERIQRKIGRTTSAIINLPRMNSAQGVNDSTSFITTGFSFNKKKQPESSKIKSINSYLNIHSIEDYLGKIKDPLEKQKELYENMKEEKIKIKNVLSNLISWDNEPTLEEIESFKLLNFDEQNKIMNKLKESNKEIRFMNSTKTIDNDILNEIEQRININQSNNILGEVMDVIKHRGPLQEIKTSKGTQIKEKKIKLTQLKFSVFDKDYDPKKFKPIKKAEKDKKKEEEEKINKFKEKDYLVQYQKQQRQIELIRRDEIAVIYKNIIINKLKKKKFLEVLDQTYRLLDKARTEYGLSVDILKERIKAVQKYYNAFIVSVDNNETKKTSHIKSNSIHSINYLESEPDVSKRNKVKKTGLDIYEEKKKK